MNQLVILVDCTCITVYIHTLYYIYVSLPSLPESVEAFKVEDDGIPWGTLETEKRNASIGPNRRIL